MNSALKEIRVFCPGTIANVSCGFDVLGLALDNVGDEMVVRTTSTPGIVISKIEGQELPLETKKNVAGVAGLKLLEHTDYKGGFEIEIYKHIKAGSGIGSSAASSTGAVWAMNELLGRPFNRLQLVEFAMEGERLASGVPHADNVAPALFGGFTLVRSYEPLDVISLPTPSELWATVIHPQIEIKTADSRRILKRSVSMKQAITQWGNVGGLVAALYKDDYELLSRSLEDVIVEPIRSILIPEFSKLKQSVIASGALGCGISGSGPSIFALSKGETQARKVVETMKSVYEPLGIPFEIHCSKINETGIKIID